MINIIGNALQFVYFRRIAQYTMQASITHREFIAKTYLSMKYNGQLNKRFRFGFVLISCAWLMRILCESKFIHTQKVFATQFLPTESNFYFNMYATKYTYE